MNVVVNYGGKWDVANAAKIAQAVLSGELKIDEINEVTFARYLDTEGLPDPDLFIRTSGELRISNFSFGNLPIRSFILAKSIGQISGE